MKIYDLHVHTRTDAIDPKNFVAQLADAGVYGSAIFSHRPESFIGGVSFKDRIDGVLAFCKDYPGRLFPVLWIHPHEDGAIEKAKEAAARGIAGFKIICNDFYIHDDASLALMHVISELKKPVCFHSGILWDSTASGKYNRPINWEEFIDVPGLKFSLAHCSWPWYDECIALYGKIQNGYQNKPNACEMFFDLTPGTPVPYRRDLFTKLHKSGYDVKHNIMFGTDCSTDYRAEWAKQWQDIDNGLYSELGVDKETRENIYENNFLRFFGVTNDVIVKAKLTSDGSN